MNKSSDGLEVIVILYTRILFVAAFVVSFVYIALHERSLYVTGCKYDEYLILSVTTRLVISSLFVAMSFFNIMLIMVHTNAKYVVMPIATIAIVISKSIYVVPIAAVSLILYFISRIINKNIDFLIGCVVICLAGAFVMAPPLSYRTYNRISMAVRAIFFSAFPGACQQHTIIDANSYICYHYVNASEDADCDGDHWLVIDKGNAMFVPIEKWSAERKNIFLGANHVKLFENNYAVTRVAPHIYWMTNYNH